MRSRQTAHLEVPLQALQHHLIELARTQSKMLLDVPAPSAQFCRGGPPHANQQVCAKINQSEVQQRTHEAAHGVALLNRSWDAPRSTVSIDWVPRSRQRNADATDHGVADSESEPSDHSDAPVRAKHFGTHRRSWH